MSDTPRTDFAQHNVGSIVEPHYVVDVEVAHDLERELAEVKEQLRLCNVDQFTTAAELAEAQAEIVRLKGEAQYGATFVQRTIDAERELTSAVAKERELEKIMRRDCNYWMTKYMKLLWKRDD